MKYKISKKAKYKKYALINVDLSFDMKKRKDKESIGTIKFYNEELINKVIKKNIDNRFKKLLELIVSMEEDGNPPDGLLLCLDETSKFKRELINKYEKYLTKRNMETIKKKFAIIEKDLKDKLLIYAVASKQKMFISRNDYQDEYEDFEEEMERHRRR